MSDELLDKINKLENRLSREKAAREEAERLLEEKSRAIYEANQDLEREVNEARRRQKQLAFLTGLAAEIGIATSIDNIVKVFLKKSHIFLNKALAVFLKVELDTNKFEISPFDFRKIADDDVTTFDFLKVEKNVSELVSTIETGHYECQLIDIAELTGDEELSGYCYVVPVVNLKKQLGLAIFYYNAGEQIDIFKLQTMESARVSLQSAIKQKLTALKLASRYQELKKTHSKLNETQQQLMQSEKMASLGELAAGVAHEINNPVGYVLSNYETLNEYLVVMSQLMEMNANLISGKVTDKGWREELKTLWDDTDMDFIKEDIQDLVSASKTGLKRVQEIVAGLKVFSHANSDETSAISLKQCVVDALQLVSNELKYDYEVIENLGSDKMICGRSGALQQVFVNMLVNAKQAMPEGGKITIDLLDDGDFQVLSIADSGVGIKPTDLKKLFTPFFTTKPVGVGTGLGLSISYGILQDHDAEIDVKSAVGKGTKFIMRFPTLL